MQRNSKKRVVVSKKAVDYAVRIIDLKALLPKWRKHADAGNASYLAVEHFIDYTEDLINTFMKYKSTQRDLIKKINIPKTVT